MSASALRVLAQSLTKLQGEILDQAAAVSLVHPADRHAYCELVKVSSRCIESAQNIVDAAVADAVRKGEQ